MCFLGHSVIQDEMANDDWMQATMEPNENELLIIYLFI